MVSGTSQLFERYVDDLLSESELRTLVEQLKNDPERLTEARETIEMHGMLQALQVDDYNCQTLLARVERVTGADQGAINFEDAIVAKFANRRRKRAFVTGFVTVAAAIAITFAILNRQPNQPVGPELRTGANLPTKTVEAPSVPVPQAYKRTPSGNNIAMLSAVGGTVWLFEPGKDGVAAGNDSRVRSGTTVVCEYNGTATVQLNEGSRFVMAPGTELTILEVEGKFDAFLGQGHVQASINPQKSSLICSTHNAQLEVLGTRFSMSASYLSTLEEPTTVSQVIVQEGRVRFSSLAGASVEVAADEMATVDQELPPLLKSVDGLKAKNLQITRATYGTETSWLDVTEAIRSRTTEHRLVLTGLFNHLQGDPRYYELKKLRVEYLIDGKRASAEFSEWASLRSPRKPASTITLPLPRTRPAGSRK